MKLFRDFRRGVVVRFHLKDNTTVEGEYQGCTRRFYQLRDGAVEGDGAMVRLGGGTLLVQRRFVKLVQVL